MSRTRGNRWGGSWGSSQGLSEFLWPGAVIFVVIAGGVFGQSTATRPRFDEFEVASIKPSPPVEGGRWIRMLSGNEFAAKNHALKTLVAAAYNLSPRAISGGSAWVYSERYDILARTPGGVRPDWNEQMAMLRKLLSDRFHLAFHREQKEMRAYALTVAKGGPKLKESSEPTDASPEGPPPLIFVVSPQLIRLPGRNATMAELASVMPRAALDDPVLDKTGLAARYDFDLEFTPDEAVFGGAFGKGADDSAKPGLFRLYSSNSACDWKRLGDWLMCWSSTVSSVPRRTDRRPKVARQIERMPVKRTRAPDDLEWQWSPVQLFDIGAGAVAGGLNLHVAAEAVKGFGDAGECEGGLILGAVDRGEHLGERPHSGVRGL